ncbi:ATP-binding protein [Rugamonas rivuli]|uniref:histidine kinase n=1 Tax=Rugamonas rivuli TaxID=2743358 RepID=A0A843SIZ2_9BURK|nr:ATP-binding protein [Rugamonas rivuli]MQA22040.1 PAS domain-containing protein [Rugamonas rivuli]
MNAAAPASPPLAAAIVADEPQHAAIALSEFFDGHPVATFAIDTRHVITHWNRACEHLLGWSKLAMVGTSNHWQAFYPKPRAVLADLIVAGDETQMELLYPGKYRASALIPGAYEAEDFFPNIGASGHWLHFTAAPLRDHQGHIVGAIETLRDVTERRVAENALRRAHDNLEHVVEKRTAQLADMNEQLQEDIRQRHLAEAELRRSNLELTELNSQLSRAQQQLVQADKLASIGQLAAGVAHEINNPIGYIFSNFSTLQTYLDQLFEMLDAYQKAEPGTAAAAALRAQREQIDLDFLREDIPALMAESREGIVRVRHIVQDLKDFSRVDANQDWVWSNLHRGIDSTLNIVANEVKYKADVVKEYGDIPDIQCLPLQINQVVMNLVVNAAHAIGEQRGRITVRTGADGDGMVWIEVADNGSGIAPDTLSRIFDPFFTTKAVGKGTGLGLSLAYGIVQKHGGRIDVDTELGKGTRFRVRLPVSQPEGEADAAGSAP